MWTLKASAVAFTLPLAMAGAFILSGGTLWDTERRCKRKGQPMPLNPFNGRGEGNWVRHWVESFHPGRCPHCEKAFRLNYRIEAWRSMAMKDEDFHVALRLIQTQRPIDVPRHPLNEPRLGNADGKDPNAIPLERW